MPACSTTRCPSTLVCLRGWNNGSPTVFSPCPQVPIRREPWQGVKAPAAADQSLHEDGCDQNGLYVCSCNGHADPRQGDELLRDSQGRCPAPLAARVDSRQQLPRPAIQLDAGDGSLIPQAADAADDALTNEFGDGICDKLYLYRITWSGSMASLSDVQIVPLKNVYQTPNNRSGLMEAVQPKPGPKLQAGGGGRRNDSVFVHGGSVFGCNGAKRTADSRPGVLWYEVRISDGALLQEGFVDSPDRDFIFPSVAVDGQGNVGIGCTGTSETEFPSVYVMMRAANDPPGTMRGPVVAVPGSTCYILGRYGSQLEPLLAPASIRRIPVCCGRTRRTATAPSIGSGVRRGRPSSFRRRSYRPPDRLRRHGHALTD